MRRKRRHRLARHQKNLRTPRGVPEGARRTSEKKSPASFSRKGVLRRHLGRGRFVSSSRSPIPGSNQSKGTPRCVVNSFQTIVSVFAPRPVALVRIAELVVAALERAGAAARRSSRSIVANFLRSLQQHPIRRPLCFRAGWHEDRAMIMTNQHNENARLWLARVTFDRRFEARLREIHRLALRLQRATATCCGSADASANPCPTRLRN
jgi:hypothetical protein